ncbi:hypothetical protein [Acetivibrio saccincola]|uniref:hypothetical protein n=1 Tax=Acetivibrio saccincola TaxID=1677857 RepID=UPI002C331EF1|nr:hypothetical protein [Acetivibrio saccincola]HQD28422.1 hypothetical protein [Acetivibrio saccincola]
MWKTSPKKTTLCLCLILIFNLVTGCFFLKKSNEELYTEAINHIKEKAYPQAMGILMKLGDYKDSENLLEQIRYLIEGSYICNGTWAVGAITKDGRVQIAYKGDNNKYTGTESLNNIKAICMGGNSVEALTKDGKVITTSTISKEALLNFKSDITREIANVIEEVSSWDNIKAFKANYPQSAVAVTNDGFVYTAYPFLGKKDVKAISKWKNIVSIADGMGYIAGLKKNGTVECRVFSYPGKIKTSKWKNIVSISAGGDLIGLKKDGTVVSAGTNKFGRGEVSTWKDIIAISSCDIYTMGLKRDGTVVITEGATERKIDVSDWTDIVAIAAGEYFAIGLKSDGTMVLSGDCSPSGIETPDVLNMKDLFVPEIIIN